MSDDPLDRLRRLVARLRGPEGCPWDRQQTLADLRAYLVEEAHEAAAAIDDGDPPAVGEELGDLLFLVVFAAELLREQGGADIRQLAAAAEAKMISRHPHVFGDEQARDAAEVRKVWGRRKLAEQSPTASILDGVPATLPALLEAYRMTQKAADVGFDWPQVEGVLAKIDEELGEVREALADQPDERRERLRAELGDLLFTVANLARHLEVDPDAALASANRRFRVRFRQLEGSLAGDSRNLGELSLEELNALWEEAKSG
ncbi:MAG: nucleoside triphosphate pyrophosphohydrolase [Thermoanaerobaculia bacterium]